mgnify:CR=1 FL=1
MHKNEKQGETLFVIGGGPSIKKYDLTLLQHHQDRIIVANNAYKLFPEAFVSHHADHCWWEWNEVPFNETFKGKYKSTVGIGGSRSCYPKEFIWLKKPSDDGLSENFPMVHGINTGHQAINIAYILGAKRIVLFGFDLKTDKNGNTQWHNEHQRDTNQELWKSRFAPGFETVAVKAKTKGVEIINMNRDSLITCFEFADDYTQFI